ncbi:hypothetical protein VTI74DRAFT_10848 [Chaetomium olivicolor]
MAGTPVVGLMAGSGGPGLAAAGSASMMASLTPEEIREIQEYDKLLRFRDEILNGAHPRIKPAHLPGRVAQTQNLPPAPASSRSAVPAPSKSTAAKRAAINSHPVNDSFQSQSRQAIQQRPQVNMASNLPGLGTVSSASAGAGPLPSGKPEINPVLLQKSDDLVKAEIQLQRQRLERSLKEQFEQRRANNKASEQLAELDVGDILAKAMSLVHATPPAQSTDDTAANVSASVSADSVDDNTTFYSSRHDTPESNMVSRLPDDSEGEEMREGSPYEPELDFEPLLSVPPQPAVQLTSAIPGIASSSHPQQQPTAPALVPTSQAARVAVPGLSIGSSSSASAYQPQGSAAGGAVQPGGGLEGLGRAGNGPLGGAHDHGLGSQQFVDQAPHEPAVVRAHDLSPVAPQPTHVLPPAIAREPQLGPSESSAGPQAPPAQVAALRKQPSNGSSPESSPRGSRVEKKKNKKKKRKADRLAAETAPSPYIKPEPRSPSPLTPQYARPNKRQRYSQQQPVEIQDDEPRYEQPPSVEEGYQERYQPRVVRQERVVGYERADDYRTRLGEEPILVASPRYERVYYDDHRAQHPGGYAAGPESAQYIPREVRTVRPAPRIVEGAYDDATPFYRDARAVSRMSVRPTAYPDRSLSPVAYERPPAAMPPPRAPPRRVFVDAYGREYLDPVRSTSAIREEVVASSYERALPPRAVSRRPELLDDNAVLYRPASPAYAPARRVITQPEYAYRETAPSGAGNPMPPPPAAEYVPSRAEPPRDYIARSASVRPPVEAALRYDAPPAAYERVPAQEYYRAASARPAAAERYEVPVAFERRIGGSDETVPVAVREYAHHPPPPPGQMMRPASVRPTAGEAAAARYEVPREYTARRVEYVPSAGPGVYQDVVGGGGVRSGRETMPPPQVARAYSVVPGDGAQVACREYMPGPPHGQGAPVERYYGRAAPQGREEEGDVVYLEQGQAQGQTRGEYR